MAQGGDEASFTFNWLALKLLGRGLYSNPWSALSELVANGLDAGAEGVYVFVDARDKANAIVEVIDNGSGMSRHDIDTYVKVGYDKRKGESQGGVDPRPKGRKGIGKLAALFLSPHFFLSTRHPEGVSSWELDARDGQVEDDDKPTLFGVDETPSTPNDHLWEGFQSGTRLTMLGVNLTGYGPQAISALGTRLANQFLLPESSKPQVLLWVRQTDSGELAYRPVLKSIAFGNLSDIVTSFPDSSLCPADLQGPLKAVSIPAKGLPGGTYPHIPTSAFMSIEPEEDAAWSEIANDVDIEARTYRGVHFTLSGWIGVHATIDNQPAQINDDRFTKNKYYNPAQIRVYVRGKLASDRLLSQLGLTGTYVNYIEGEITFDLLDEDSLPDIATSNRQDFDETDNRVTLLRALVRPLVRGLIQRRNNLASEIAAAAAKEKKRREAASKHQFSEQLRIDLDQHDEIPQSTRDELQMVITNKIEGGVTPKQSYRVFISHSAADQIFAALIDELLRARGAKAEEIFFTSRTGSTEILVDDRALSEVIKRNITDDNTLIFYMTSKNFLSSQFCLFEGGAGWATRAVSEYLRLNVEYESIPAWLTNGTGEAVLLGPGNAIELTPQLHNYLIEGILNPMIEHLNRGRAIAGEAPIPPLVKVEFPSPVEMAAAGTTVKEYFDPDLAAHWMAIVQNELPAYLDKYLAPSSEARLSELESEIAHLKVLSEASHRGH